MEVSGEGRASGQGVSVREGGRKTFVSEIRTTLMDHIAHHTGNTKISAQSEQLRGCVYHSEIRTRKLYQLYCSLCMSFIYFISLFIL